MKSIRYFYLFFIVAFLFASVCSQAQTSRIAIVSLADTTIVNHHLGLTIFTNFTDTLHIDLSVSKYIEQQFKNYLSPYYTVSIVHLPDSVAKGKSELYGNWGINKLIKKWIGDCRNKYDLVIFTYSTGIPTETNIGVPKNTSGLYSKGRTEGFYSTIFFVAFRTNNLEKIEYYLPWGKFILPLKEFKLPDDNRSLTPEMLDMIKTGLANYLDYRVIHYLTKTYIVDQNKIDNVNSGTRFK